MNVESNNTVFQIRKCAIGILAGIGLFCILELIAAFLIDRELISLNMLSAISLVPVFIGCALSAFVSGGNRKNLIYGSVTAVLFWGTLFLTGLIIYRTGISAGSAAISAAVTFLGSVIGSILKAIVVHKS